MMLFGSSAAQLGRAGANPCTSANLFLINHQTASPAFGKQRGVFEAAKLVCKVNALLFKSDSYCWEARKGKLVGG